MKVIFLEDVPLVAQAGDVKEVADGFGRNYLLPRRLAQLATPGALKQWEQQQRVAARHEVRLEHRAEELSAQIGQLSVTIQARVGRQGRLYGSVTSGHIAAEISRAIGHSIDRRKVELEAPIRQTGTYRVPVRLAGDTEAVVTIVVRGEGEALEQEATPGSESIQGEGGIEVSGGAEDQEEAADQETR